MLEYAESYFKVEKLVSMSERLTLNPSDTNILIIEDCDDTRDNLSTLMKLKGYNVLECSSSSAACNLIKANRIDLIITDLRLKNESGMDFIRCLRQHDVETPIIITSAYSEKELLLEAIQLSVSSYLIKPFKTAELFENIEKALRKKSNSTIHALNELHDGYAYNPIDKTIIAPDKSIIQLSKKEYLLLELLLKNKNKIVPYTTIEKTVWSSAPMSIEALRTMVRTIRKKTYSSIISNVNAHGYKMEL